MYELGKGKYRRDVWWSSIVLICVIGLQCSHLVYGELFMHLKLQLRFSLPILGQMMINCHPGLRSINDVIPSALERKMRHE